MENERKKPRVLPNPPHKPGVVEPIIAAGEMTRPGKESILSDVDGSYTGRPITGDHPVQDADDL